MNVKKNDTYNIEQETYVLSINYTYYYSSGTYEQPPEADLEIKSVTLNGMNITDFYWDFIDDAVHSQVWEHAQ